MNDLETRLVDYSYEGATMGFKRFDIFWEAHLGLGIRWRFGYGYPVTLSLAIMCVTITVGIGRLKDEYRPAMS